MPEEEINPSTFPRLKPGVCSGLILSGAFISALKGGVWRRRSINSEGEPEKEEFGELIKFTASGFLGGILAGVFLDYLGFQRSSIGQWFVRTL
jgi:hypothetical protein